MWLLRVSDRTRECFRSLTADFPPARHITRRHDLSLFTWDPSLETAFKPFGQKTRLDWGPRGTASMSSSYVWDLSVYLFIVTVFSVLSGSSCPPCDYLPLMSFPRFKVTPSPVVTAWTVDLILFVCCITFLCLSRLPAGTNLYLIKC